MSMFLFIFFFILRIESILTHTREKGEGLKKIDSGVYKKMPNSWIHNTYFKPF